jgi:membrane protease YdiL (CAAX protease family)
VVLATLALVVGVRAWATRTGVDALVVGALFGVALAALAIAASRASASTGRYPSRPVAAPLAARMVVGAVFGLGLVVVVVAGAAISGNLLVPGLGRPAAPLLPWAGITILVAAAEEAILRGRLFDALRRTGGVGIAVGVTTVAFALMHVPLYGWHVVPLDLAVGLGLAGLRLATGGIVAPAAAHAVADLATWWL